MILTFLQGKVRLIGLYLFQKEELGTQLQSEWDRGRAQRALLFQWGSCKKTASKYTDLCSEYIWKQKKKSVWGFPNSKQLTDLPKFISTLSAWYRNLWELKKKKSSLDIWMHKHLYKRACTVVFLSLWSSWICLFYRHTFYWKFTVIHIFFSLDRTGVERL